MDISIGDRWKSFVEEAVKSGRFPSAGDLVQEGLRLVEEREAKLAALRATIQASIAEGGSLTLEEVTANLNARYAQLKSQGF